MIAARSLATHVAILAVSGVLALRTYTKDENASERHAAVELWGGSPEKLERVRFEHKDGTMSIEPRKDGEGVYYVGEMVKTKTAKADKPKDPHASVPGMGHDEEEEDSSEAADPSGPKTVKASFISVEEGNELFEKLAPLKVLRVLGKIGPDRTEEFGFHESEGSLYVRIAGKEHSMVFGGSTPGGSDRYVRDPETQEAYVIEGEIMRDMMDADQRLVEREMHEWEVTEVARVKLTRADATRELTRNTQQKDFWSSSDTPEQKDETASNWMSKVERLRVTSYQGEKAEPPIKPGNIVVKLEYFDDRNRNIGFLELARQDGASERPEYVARTEHTRWYATVLRSTSEQIDQDVESVMTP